VSHKKETNLNHLPSIDSINLISRTEIQIQELKAMSLEWQKDPFGFWSFDEVLKSLQRPSYLGYYVSERFDGPWKAMVLVDLGPFTADLMYVYVRPCYRKMGLARRLLDMVEVTLSKDYSHLETLFLEVRVSHLDAMKLYEKFGMERISRRKSYYKDGEDAFVYQKKLKGTLNDPSQ
jgi:ribosomal-protein-alanine N-acetyltransferase